MRDFFTYTCDRCNRPFCERIWIMNLALDYTEEAYCLECLATSTSQTPHVFYGWILDYIESRDCFKTPWTQFNPTPCPRIPTQECFCKASP